MMILKLMPLIILSIAVPGLMLMIAFYRRPWVAFVFSLTTLSLAILFLLPAAIANPHDSQIMSLIAMDRYASCYMGLLFMAAIVTSVLAWIYFRRSDDPLEEFHILLLTATLGSAILTAATHLASLFLGLEILSISLYTMIAYPRESKHATEAAIKYLVLAAGASGFLLFGMALLYAQFGTMFIPRLASLLPLADTDLLFTAGLTFFIVGIGFKLAVAPFHLWTPDVYQGAPAPVAAFIATVSKGGAFALLLRFFLNTEIHSIPVAWHIFNAIALASMIIGNLLALRQTNIKRILAYSSIAHMGYLLVAFLSFGNFAMMAAGFYLMVYLITILAAFTVVTLLSSPTHEADTLEEYTGLIWRNPWIGSMFALALFSLAGIPLTAGFIGKTYLLIAGEQTHLWLLTITLILTSAMSIVYYLRIIVTLFHPLPAPYTPFTISATPAWAGITILSILSAFIILFGIAPHPAVLLFRMLTAVTQ